MPAFVEWHLYSADIHSSDGLVDPMVVDMKIQGIKVLLQEDLIAVAEGAKGKKPSKRFVVVLFNTGGGGGGGYPPFFFLIGLLGAWGGGGWRLPSLFLANWFSGRLLELLDI